MTIPEPADVEAALIAALREDGTLQSLLAPSVLHDDATPAVWEVWAPEQQKEPYITLFGDYTAGDSPWALRTGTVDVHIWGRGPGHNEVRKIRDAVVRAVDRRMFFSDRTGHSIRVFAGADSPVSEDEPSQVHWLQALEVRFWRQADLEAMINE